MIKAVLFIACTIGFAFAQTELYSDSDSIKLCWDAYPNDSAKYIVYYYNQNEPSPTWKEIAVTAAPNLTVMKTGKQRVVFGVCTVLFGDTSEIHSSLDDNACLKGTNDCSSCTHTGSWLLRWKVKKPKYIIKMEVYEN